MYYLTTSKSSKFSVLLCSRLDNRVLKEKRSNKTHFTNPKDHSPEKEFPSQGLAQGTTARNNISELRNWRYRLNVNIPTVLYPPF